MAQFTAFAKTIVNNVLLWIHGRRFGLFGDGQSTNNSSAVLDGVTIGSTRTGANSFKVVAAGLNTSAATIGTGGVAATGVLVGDTVDAVWNLTTPADATASFESTISTAGYIQQISGTNLSASTYGFFVNPQAAA